ncbi:hypothetical protein LAZ67_20001435, partial [Cordylochernes scorpioides]
MSEDCLSRIEVFNGENFSLWKFQFRLLLEQQKLLELLEGLEIKPNVVSSDSNSESSLQNWKSKDVKARMLLSQAIELRFLQPLMNCISASQMWQKLLAIHEQKSEFTIGLLWQQFFDARLTSETISDYIAKIENISAQISQMGGTITEDQKVAKISNTLPSSMRYFVAAWESLDPKAQTLSNLTARLLIEETRNQQSGSSKQDEALLHRQARTKPKDTQRSFQDAKKNTKCHYCHKIGHWSRECRKRLANEKNISKNLHDSKGSSSDFGLILCDNQVEPNDIWYADSGASCSMTFRREWFKTYTPFTSDHPIYLGDNSTLLAEGMGDIEIQAYVDGGWYNTYIRNVLYSPQLKKNLYSLSTSTRRGFNVIIKHDKLQIFMDNDLKAVGVRHDGLYRMLFKVTSSSQGYITSENKLQLWHERLAHLPVATLREMATKELVDGLQPQDLEGEFFFCEGCQLGKAHRKSSYPSDGKNYQLGEFIYADICGPMQTQSLSKYLYFCLFKDYFSGYRHIYFVKNKSDVLDIFKEYATLIYTQTGNKIKVLRTDNALEFKSDNFADLCKRLGIIHEFTAPYVHEQIGRIERDNRTIVEAARSMLNSRNLPGFFWAEACNTATYILNRSATKQTPGTTPYELFFGTKPNVANYKIFGCNAYMHIPKENRKKWDNKSIKLMFLGYENTSKNFRLWDWKTRKIRISKDVTFDEKATPHSDRESTKPKEIIFHINSAPDESPVATTNFPVQEMLPVSDISSHPMITRSKVSNSQCNFALADEPSNYIDAITSSDSERWKLAMDEEIDALNKIKTWTLERLADGHKPIGCKWVYKIKTESDGTIQRFKTRLVAQGYSQIKNVDYFDTFSPVVRYDSLRILLSHAASERMFLKQFDVKTAFLNGELEELVYLEQPEGYKRDDNSCYRLHKSLYGLRQSSRNWNKKFTNFLYSHNIKTSDADPCIFIGTHNDSNVILALYVDDGIILSKDKEAIPIIMDELEHAFDITSGSVNFFVGLQIEQSEDRASIFIHQSSYIDKILSKFNMADCIPASVPMDPSVILTKQDCPTPEQKEKMPKFPFREAVGSLMFASCVSRPDITYAVSQVSKFLEYPGTAHCTTVKNIFRYLKGTPHMGILFTGQDQLVGYSDSDFARDVDSRKSTTGYAFMMNGGTVSWASQRQPIIALSNTESEYIAACSAAKELIWIRRLLQGIGCDITKETELYIDNQAAIKPVENPVFHKRTKHIDVRYHFIRSKHEEGELKVHHVCSSEQLADIMTKPLPRNKFHYLRGLLNILDREGVLTKITKLNGLNYSSWSFQIKLILMDNDLWSIVDPGEVKPEGGDIGLINKFNTRQNKALAKICLSIGEEQQNHIRHLNSPKEVWDELQRLYAPRDSKHRILQLRRKLYSQKFCQHANMDAYLGSINLIVSELTGVGDKIEDGDLSMLILCGMPEDWDNVISTMCNLPESEFTSANIRRKLLAEAERRYATTNEGMGALSVRNSNKKQFPHENQGSKTVRKCFGCGKTGHIARDCFKLKKNNGKQQEKGAIHQHHEAKNLSVMYNAAVVSEEDTWVRMQCSYLGSDMVYSLFYKLWKMVMRSTKETQTLALVHCDLMGPFNIESWGGSRFVLTIIVDASRYTRVYFLKRKGDTLEKFKEWMKEAENQTGFSLKRIRTDNGLEFCSSPWDIFTKAHGIVHERTMVYTPEQNGVAERMNRTLLNLVRSTVNSCNLPNASWAELTNTAAYLRNRVTNRHNEEKTPFELWFGKRPALQHLRAIGCETFVHVPKQRMNSKLQPRATKGILVGYSLQGRGWRIWIPEKRQVVESRNCVFKEEILYKQPKRERDTLSSVHFSSKEASFQEESNADQPVDRETEELIGTTGGIDQPSYDTP